MRWMSCWRSKQVSGSSTKGTWVALTEEWWPVPDRFDRAFQKLMSKIWTSISRVYRQRYEKENLQWEVVVQTKVICWCQKRKLNSSLKPLNAEHNLWMHNMLTLSSGRLHWVSLLSADNRKLRLQLIQAHQDGTITAWKTVAWSDECWFQLLHSDGSVRLWWKTMWNHKSKQLYFTLSGWWWCTGRENTFFCTLWAH